MAFFTVTMTHPDGEGWGRHAAAHVDYLRGLVAAGTLRASGPLFDGPLRAGFLVFEAETREAVEALVRDDPFAREGLIVDLTVRRWDPLFGAFAAGSSGSLPGFGPTGGVIGLTSDAAHVGSLHGAGLARALCGPMLPGRGRARPATNTGHLRVICSRHGEPVAELLPGQARWLAL